nr:hypothetical protein [Tanacetum cinerariifolium]
SDEELEAPMKDQPLPTDASPTALLPSYIDDFNLKEDEEDPEEDPETMTTVNQGMSVEKIERVIAQRVANAIEAIAIYKTKTNLAHKSMSRIERQKEKVEENASNKRKWEVKFHKRVDMIHGKVSVSKPKTMQDAIEIATKLMNKKISTLVECQTENKKRGETEEDLNNIEDEIEA